MSRKPRSQRREAVDRREPLRLKLLVVLATLGVGLSTWLLMTHFRLAADPSAASACNFGGYLNCDVVNASRYATFLGIPIAYGGLAVYLLLGGLALTDLQGGRRQVALAYARGLGALSVACSVYLALVSALVLQAFCLFCAGLYAVNLGVALLGWVGSPQPGARFLPVLRKDLRQLLRGPNAGPSRVAVGALLAGAVTLAVVEGTFAAKAPEATIVKAGSLSLSASPGQTDGPKDARVTVVEFSDFECPYCRRATETLDRLRARYADRVRFVFKHFPLDPSCNRGAPQGAHDRACAAAEAAVCAGQQGRFWDFQEGVFAGGASERSLLDAARHAGLDLDAWKACRFSPTTRQAVQADIEDGLRIGVRSTPTFLVGDRMTLGAMSEEALARAIEAALAEADGGRLAGGR